jgi:hypothetical protein
MKKMLLLIVFIIAITVIVGLILYFQSPSLFQPKPEIDMAQKIRDEISNDVSILNYDWIVWSKTFRDSGGVLTKMDTWEQFKESYRQSIKPFTIMLDEANRVVWFKGSLVQAVYYEY